MRDTIRNKIDFIQTEPIVKNITASAASKAIAIGFYDYFSGKSVDTGIVKPAVMAAVGTGLIKYYFNI